MSRWARSSTPALEVRTLWRGELLSIAHVCPPRPFVIGADRSADFRVDQELVDGAAICLPPAEGTHEHAGLTFEVREIDVPVPATEGRVGIDWSRHTWTATSFALHGLLLLAMSLSPPSASALSLSRLSESGRYTDYLALSLLQPDPPPDWIPEASDVGGAPVEAHAGDNGSTGEPDARRQPTRRATRGEPSRVPTAPVRASADGIRRDSIIGVLERMAAEGVASSAYTALVARGGDADDALSALLGDRIASSWGPGLGTNGPGRGGGGDGRGVVAVGRLSTRGGCLGQHCRGSGPGAGIGRGADGSLRAHRSRVPRRVRPGPVTVRGALSKETIRRIMGRQLNRVRFCYEQGLQRRSDLAGRVAVKFVIGAGGAVRAAAVGNSTVGDATVERCITRVVERLTFPAPGGIVTVTYPFALSHVGS